MRNLAEKMLEMDVGGKVSQNMSFLSRFCTCELPTLQKCGGYWRVSPPSSLVIHIHVNKLGPELPSSVDPRSKRLSFALSLSLFGQSQLSKHELDLADLTGSRDGPVRLSVEEVTCWVSRKDVTVWKGDGLTLFLVNQEFEPIHSVCPQSKQALPKVSILLFFVIQFFASLCERMKK